MRWFDTHCHLDRLADGAREVARARRAGVRGFLVPALEGVPGALPEGDDVRYTVGQHPSFLPSDPGLLAARAELAADRLARDRPRCVGVGEVGLDYLDPRVDRARQRRALEAQLALARTWDVPVVVHLREGHGDFLAIARSFPGLRVVMHAFSGSPGYAASLLHHLGEVFFGFGGAAVLEGARRALASLRAVPRERVVLETDAPDMTPRALEPPNTPANLPWIGDRIAARLGEPGAELAARTWRNAHAVLGREWQEAEP